MRLYRPHIPIKIKCRVAMRQLGYDANERDAVMRQHNRRHGALLANLLGRLAGKLGCAAAELRLDHNPALALRPQERRGLGRKTYYTPDANDPDHLEYRPHGAEHAGSHDIKTRVRGEHGQFSDHALIRRKKRRERRLKMRLKIKARTRWPKRPFPKGRGFERRG